MTNTLNRPDKQNKGHHTHVLIVFPVYNEEKVLRKSINTVIAFLQTHDKYMWKLVIADNNSKDMTGDIGRDLASENPLVHYMHIPQKGVGVALRKAWEQSNCDVVSYMDIDLSTSLEALIRSIDLLIQGADIVTANRFDRHSVIKRSLKREIVSRCYNMILRIALRSRIHDAHCGFKVARREVAQNLLSYIEDNGFFFAAEFLFYGEKLGYRIVEVPVNWTEDLNTKANIVKDAYDDFCGIYRLIFKNKLDKADNHS